MTKILLAIDHSPCSSAATEALLARYRPTDTEVRVLHVVEWPNELPSYYAFGEGPTVVGQILALREKAHTDAESLVTGVADRLRSAGFTADARVREGDARSTIVDAATAWSADLIVMGSHGRRGLDRFAMGSVAESVMRRAGCSVEIVRPREHSPAAAA